MKAFENAFKELGSRDLSGLLRLDRFASSSTWKTTAPLDALCERGSVLLMQGLFRVCSNGVIQSSKLKTCLSKLQSEQGRVNFSKFSDSDFFDTCDSYIRQFAANWRSIKSDCGAYGRAVRKSSPAEKDIIDNMLTFLNLDDKNKAPAAADDRQQPKGSHEAEVSEPPAAGSAEVSASSSAFPASSREEGLRGPGGCRRRCPERSSGSGAQAETVACRVFHGQGRGGGAGRVDAAGRFH